MLGEKHAPLMRLRGMGSERPAQRGRFFVPFPPIFAYSRPIAPQVQPLLTLAAQYRGMAGSPRFASRGCLCIHHYERCS